jgi:nucleotide-binding universal stress UspA family protein
MKEIVVAIDFSKSSIRAFRYALAIAAKTNSNLKLVYISKRRDVHEEIFDEKKGQFINIRKNLKELAEANENTISGNITYKILTGKIYEEIINQAKYTDAWMLIAGAHGMSGYEETWIGNNAFKIFTHAVTPLILVKKNSDMAIAIDKIVLPIDSTPETLQKVPFTVELAKSLKAQINVLSLANVNLKDQSEQLKIYTKEAIKIISKAGLRYFSNEIECVKNSDSIIEYTIAKEADLISIMTDQESNTPDNLTILYAEEIVNQSPVPVLSFKTQKNRITAKTAK